MRAISVARFGGPEVLAAVEAPDPVAGPGELVVAASASDVMFVDTVIRSGRGVGFFPIRPPYVPGSGVGGRVISVGDGVDDGWLGRPVIAHIGSGAPAGTPNGRSSASRRRSRSPTASIRCSRRRSSTTGRPPFASPG